MYEWCAYARRTTDYEGGGYGEARGLTRVFDQFSETHAGGLLKVLMLAVGHGYGGDG